MTAVTASSTAMAAIEASSMAIAKYAASAAGLDPADYDDMTELAASSTAMAAVAASPVAVAAIWQSTVAIQVLQGNATAWATFTGASSQVMGKAVAILAGLNPNDYADMTAVAASSTAMAAVAASQTAMAAVAASQTALNAIAARTTALDALYAKKSRMSGASTSKSGKFIVLQISTDNAFNTSQYGYATLSDGSQPDWSNYKSKYAYFKQYKKVATYMKNDSDSDDWIDYFSCS